MQTNINKPDSDKDVLLKMVDIEKSFPGVKALDHAQLTVRRGTVHALMGENGAGKSTLMKCLFGVYSKDGGHIYVDGQEVNYKNSKEALENGVAMVHQELNQALKRNVMDNMWLGRFPTVSKFLPFTSEKKMYDETARIFKELEINVDPKTIMSTMPVSQRQMVEIAKAVSYNSKIIVFDEPTSSLTEEEAEHLFRIINMLRDRGCAIIYISHKMEEILRISDEVTIMCDGRWVATKPASELTMNEIIRLMVGRELTNRYPKKDNEIGDVLLKVENLGSEYTNLRDVSFEANRGEILGVAGLDGSGRTELLEQIFGITTRRSGKIFLDGKEVKNKTPHESIKNGFALLTEERRATGIFGILNIRENATVASLKKYMTGPFVSKKKMKVTTDKYINSLKIKTPSQETKISSLSGGNQQKVIFARWLLTDPTVLLLDEPTRGIDVGAKYEIYQLILDLAKKGKTVIMVSSEMPELLGVCDKILVMSGGRLAGEVDAGTTNQEEIMTLEAADTSAKKVKRSRVSLWLQKFKAADRGDKKRLVTDLLFNNAMYIIIAISVIFIAVKVPAFLSISSIVNIISLTAAKLPIALGIAGCIVLTGTDISAGRCVGLTACVAASLLQMSDYANKMFKGLDTMPLIVVLLAVIAIGAAVGLVNGFFVAKFKLHPFIVTLSTQLIVFGTVLMYLMIGGNNGQTLSGLDPSYTKFITGTLFSIDGVAIPKYVLYSIILTAVMWVVWNKTKFGKNMFAVGSNEEAARVSGVNVFVTILIVFILAGVMYGITGFIEGARIASCSANTGLNYECDAIAACVIGGVSFVGGTGKISGIVVGVLLLQIIFAGLNFLSVSANMLYIIKGMIILIACAIDMRKYLARR